MDPAPNPPALALVRDLIFASRITAAARSTATEVSILREPALLAGRSAELLLVDLNQAGALDAATEWKRAHSSATVVGFVSHVDRETIEKARAAGLDRVLARSAFGEMIPQLLAQVRPPPAEG